MSFNLIKFKKGTKTGLDSKVQNSQIEEGSFYLTIDNAKETSRLYIGTAANKVLPVNSNITIVAKTSDLTASHASNFNEGDFAYVTDGNILAVKHDNNWTQINAPDSRAIKDLTPTVTTSDGTATIKWALRDQNENEIKTDAGATPTITMQGASGVTVSNSGTAITITGDPATLGSSAVASNSATISLTSTGNTASGSVAVSGGNGITVGGGANNIQITGTTNKAMTVATKENTNGFEVAVVDTNDDAVKVTIDPKITLGTHTDDEISFVNGKANLPVYTKSEVDSLLTDVDAMTYKGLVTRTNIVNDTSGLHVGDTFKASSGFTLPADNSTAGEITVKAGDLLIVSSSNTEGADGTITGNKIKYDVVPSGDDFYNFKGLGGSHNGNGIEIEDGSTGDVIASLEIAAGNQIAVSSTHSGTDGANTAVTVAHGQISTTSSTAAEQAQSTHTSKTFNVLTGVTTDNGHVTSTTVTPITVVDTVSQIDTSTTGTTVTTTGNTSTVASTIALVDEANDAINSGTLGFSLASQNLTLSSTGTAITMNYVWETFD